MCVIAPPLLDPEPGAEPADETEVAPAPAAALPVVPKFKNVVIAVHGIGDQARNATVRSVANRLATAGDARVQLPLGFFHGAGKDEVQVKELLWPPEEMARLGGCGFAEVYWADIPAAVQKEAHTLEESRAWAATVAARVEATHHTHLNISEQEMGRVGGTLSDVIETITVLGNLLWVFGKIGVFKFELKAMLDDYLGDVQFVAEYPGVRRQVIDRFKAQMEHAYEQANEQVVPPTPQPKATEAPPAYKGKGPHLHIVAHSEGTVVSFLGLLEGLKEREAWALAVRSFSTLGSPIDKHLVLWPEMWAQVQKGFPRHNPGYEPVRWTNYYDYGDPVGFALDTARFELETTRWGEFFDFPASSDLGFARYFVPGQAHNDYWTDAVVFTDIWKYGVEGQKRPRHSTEGPVPSPRTQAASGAAKTSPPAGELQTLRRERVGDVPFASTVSTAIPYVASVGLHVLAVLVLYLKVESVFNVGPGFAPLACDSLALSAVLVGMTAITRFPRLTKDVTWRVAGVILFLLAMWAYWGGVSPETQVRTGFDAVAWINLFGWHPVSEAWRQQADLTELATVSKGIFITTSVVAVLIASALWRRKRLALMIAGGVQAGFIVAGIFYKQPKPEEFWTLCLAGAAFLFFWWLGVLVFDLAFTWHRYIRWARGQERLVKAHKAKHEGKRAAAAGGHAAA